MKPQCIITLLFLTLVLTGNRAWAENNSRVYVKDTVMVTYPFKNPDPVPDPGKLWPYWRFRDFSFTSEPHSWKMVVIENDYLRVKVFPQIGGKIWSVFDKRAGKEMFYDNDVVKFRDISLRGPWTSGGIEFNYGIIGHAPTCAHPVDWTTMEKEDGSASCFICASERLSSSNWSIEINLPKDAVWLRTSSIWHNGSSEYQPLYSWANSAVKASEDLMLVYPADNAVGHYGENLTYPLNSDGKDISLYRNQAYGADKSYHMIGSHKPFFGVYYMDEDWGVLHYSMRDEKVGRKYYSWAQSEQGSIWIDLLTDTRPQYIEMQSGRLFNQNFIKCSQNSSYRQFLFTPYGTECWSDYWLPYQGIGPADEVNLNAVVSVKADSITNSPGKTYIISIYPLQRSIGALVVKDSCGKALYKEDTLLEPAKALRISVSGEAALLTHGEKSLWRRENGRSSRPQHSNEEFDRKSIEGRLLLARDMFGMRMYRESEAVVDTVLKSQPANIDALNIKANLLFRRMEYSQALSFTDKVLAIDQYNPDAGYTGGLVCAALGGIPEAMERFEVAAICNSPLRSSCFTELAKLHFLWDEKDISADYARKALIYNGNNITAMYILCKCGRCNTNAVKKLNPLSHFAVAEQFLSGEMTPSQFHESFRGELPWADILETALFYNTIGLKKDAAAILKTVPQQNILTALWIAYLEDTPDMISKAEVCPVDFVFPFRREDGEVLQWAVEKGGGWKSRYLLAMLQDYFGNSSRAAALLDCNDTGYAPYYAYRYKFSNDISDLKTACRIDPQQWIYVRMLGEELVRAGKSNEAVKILTTFYKKHPQAIQVGDILMDAYISENRYSEAEKIVDLIRYLPFEGQRGSHDRYRAIKLHLAAKAIDSGKLTKAEELVEQALQWPVRLGAGKPYDNMIDTSTEDWLKKEIEFRRNYPKEKLQPIVPQLESILAKERK